MPPWARPPDPASPTGAQERLWRAANQVFRRRRPEARVGASEFAERIAKLASLDNPPEDSPVISAWRESTRQVLRSESTVRLDQWRDNPVGIAIQMVLARPDPIAFKQWFKDLPDLPPAVAWSAATLCGLLRGYRNLDSQFRGGALQRELLSVHAFRLTSGSERVVDWVYLTGEKPQWHKSAGRFVLSWGGKEFARKRENSRGKWFAANLEDAEVAREARLLAKGLGWQCTDRKVSLRDTNLSVTGPGSIILAESETARQLDIRGSVQVALPADAVVEENLNVEQFLHMIAVEPGPLPEPPATGTRTVGIASPEVDGLLYVPDFLSRSEEERLIGEIDKGHWQSGRIRRRVQHYGWRCDYGARRINTSMRLGPLPDWALSIARRLVSERLLRELPDQVIVNEYHGSQGISRHVDHEGFADGIVMISLLESWEMVFRNPDNRRKVSQLLQRRSATIMRGAARYHWTHEIPRRLYEPGKVKRCRRISLTFRKVLEPEGRNRANR